MGRVKSKFSWAKAIILFLSFLLIASTLGVSLSLFRDNTTDEQSNNFAPIVLSDDSFNTLKSQVTVDMLGKSILVQPVSFVVSKDTSSSIYVRAYVKFDGVANDARQKLAYESLTAATPVAGKSYKWTRFGEYYYLCDGSNQLVSLSSTNSGEVFNLLEKETNIVPEDIIDEKFAGGEKVSLSVTLQSVQTSKVSSSNIERAHSSFNAVEPTLANTKTQCSIYFYDANGLSLGSQTVAYGKGVNIPTPASQSGKQHIGWNTKSDYTGATLDEEDLSSVYEDLVLYAEFDALTYNVTVIQPTDESGNQIGTITPGSTTMRYGQSLTFRVIPNANYYIYGVYIENDETHQKKNIGSLTEFVVNGYTSDITIWADISQEVIFLDINGGTGTQPRITFNEDKTKFVLSEIEPVGPNGKEFYYYSTNPLDNEEGQNGIRIDLGVEYPLSYLEGNKVLYAIYLTPTENYQTATNYIVVPKNVTSIEGKGEKNMFGVDTPDVKFVTLSRNVKKIGNSAFKNLDGLTGLSMSTVVDSIGNNAFENCVSLEQFVFGPFVNKIGSGAFKNCVSLSTLKNFENIPTTEFVGTFEGCTMLINVTLPSVATKIEGTFKNCSNLIEVVLPNGLRNIGESTFENCVSISGIEIPSTISFLGEKAFRNCVALTEIAGLENIVAVEIPDYIFENCVSLKEVYIPSNTAIIGRRAFDSCSALEKIINLSIVKVGEVCEEAFLNCSSLGELIFNGSLNIVGSQAFAGSGVSKVSLSQRLSSLGESAFENCVNLSTVQNLGIISVIAQNTFKNCSNLFSITIPATVTTIETLAFENCSSLSSLNVPASVQTIGVDALKNATGLKSITLQGDLTTIYNLASTKQNWYYNTMMVEALNTKGYYTTFVSDWIVTNINGNNYITGYRGGDVNVTIPYIITDERGEQTYIYGVALNTYDKISGFENVVLEEGIQSIFILEGENVTTEEQLSYPCFKDCKTLKSISLPSTLSQISDGAFAGCENLTQIIGLENTKITKMGELFPAWHTSIWKYDEIIQINNQDIKIAYDYKEILGEGGKNYRGTFESTALKEIKLPATLQIIGPLCFSNILTISTIHIPASVRAIGAGAFSNLPALQSITGLENCVLDYKATVDGKVFECGFAAAVYYEVNESISCKNFPIFWGLSIKTLTLPSFATFFASDLSGNSVGSLIAGCLSLEEITLLGDWPQEFSLATIEESEFGINSYQWYLDGRKMTTAREAGTYTIFPSSETSDWVVDENGMIIAYKGSNTTVTVPASVVQNGEVVTVVGVKSFRNPILANITVSEGITKIDAGAFANMTKLKRVKLAKSILEIGDKAFENCSSLVSIVLPENTKTVGNDIFIGCSSIKIIVLNNDISTEQSLANISDGDWFYQNGSSSVSTSLMKSKGIYSKYSNVATTAEWEVKSYQTKNYITAYLGSSQKITVPAVVVESDYSEAYEIYGLAALKKFNFTSIIISEGIQVVGVDIDMSDEASVLSFVSLGLGNPFDESAGLYFPFMYVDIKGQNSKYIENLSNLVLPDSLNTVGYYGFAGVKLKGSNTLLELNNLVKISDEAFGMSQVDEIRININTTKTLSKISRDAFRNSTAQSISIGYGPTLIEESAFSGCANLIYLSLPASIVTIENWAFDGCSSLVELNLKNARQIGSISGCSSLEKIILGAALYSPYAVSNISGKNGKTWFYEGGSDTAVSYFDLAGTYLAEKPDLSSVWTYEQINGKWYITGYTGNAVNLTVPSSLMIDGTATQITGIKSIKTNEGVEIESLVISEGISEILENALSGKTKLSSIALPSTLTSIGANAFSGTIIKILTLGCDSLTLSVGALDGMSKLEIINVQNGVNSSYVLPTNATWTYISYDETTNQSSITTTTTLQEKGIYTTLANVATTNEWIVGNENNSYFIAGYKLDYNDSTKTLEIPRLVINHKTFDVYEISSIKSLYMKALTNTNVEISLKISEGITKIDTRSYSYSFNDVIGEYFSINQSLRGNGNKIVSIELPTTLLELGEYAFAGLDSLKEIKNLENTQIKELKQNAFYNNSNLTQLVFPLSMNEISSNNFSNCSALMKITLKSGLSTSFNLLNVGNGIWYYNSETTRTSSMQKAGIYSSSPIQNIGLWVVELIEGKHYITAYLGGATELVVPYELFNEDTGEIVQIFGVRGIGKTDLESITFEEGIEEIGEVGASTNIFGGACNTLSKITLASTVTRVYDKALDNNETTNIIITILGTLKGQDENYVGYKLSSIRNTAWYYGVKNVENMKQVGSYTTFRVEAYMPKEDVLGAMGSASSFEERETIANNANYPSADYAWYLIADWESGGNNWYIYSYLGSKSELDIPHYVMDYFTVDGCGILRELDTFLTLYKQIESTKVIQQDITKITLEEGYKTFGIDDGETTPSSGGAMATVKTVVLPSTLTNLGAGAFMGFASLENINLDNTKITEIPSSAFYGAINLKQIRLPSNVTKIDTLAFYAAGLIELELNEGLISIGSGALSGLSYLKVLTIPSTLSSIQNNAMSPEAFGSTDYLTSLEKIIIKKDLSIPLSVESITKSVFYKNGSQIALSTISEAGTYLSYICGTTDDWNYETIDGKNYITGYVGKKVVVDVPTYIWDRATGGTIEIYGVKSLNNSKIRKLTIREGIKAVGNGTNNIINGTYNNTLTYASFPFSLETNDANILNDCNALETMHFYSDPKTQLEISSIKQATWHSHNMWLENAFWANNYTSYDDVVTQISLAGGYSTYSIGENIVQVKTAQGGFGGDKWINFVSPDIFIPAFGIFKPTNSDILPEGYEHLLQKVVPMESVLSLRGYLGTSADSQTGMMTAQYENSLTFNSMVFAEGITRIGDKGNKNNGVGAMNSLYALGPIVNMVYRVGSEDKINLLSFDGSFESGVPSGINANGGTLSISNSAYAGSKALSYTKSGASKATITTQLEKGVYVFEAMVKSSVASAPLQVQLTSGSSFQTYNSEICSAGNGYKYVFVKFEVQSATEANLNLVQSAIYDCMSLYRVDRGLPTTLTVLGANAFSMGYSNESSFVTGLTSINLSQTAIEELELFALGYTFTNYMYYEYEIVDGKHVVYNYEIPFYTSYVNKGSENDYEITYTMTFPTSIEKFVRTNENDVVLTSANGYIWNINEKTITKPDGTVINIIGESENAIYISDVTVEVDWNFDVWTNTLTYAGESITMVESSEGLFWGDGYIYNAKTNRLITPHGVENGRYFTQNNMLKKDLVVAIPKTLTTIGYMALNTGATKYYGLEKSSLKSLEVSAFGGDIMLPFGKEDQNIIDSTPYGKNLTELNLPASFEEITKTSSSDIALGPIIMFGLAGMGENGQNLTYPTNFEGYAFVFNKSLQNINVAQGNTTFSSKDGVLFNANQTKLIAFPSGRSGDYSIPETVTTIGEASFMVSKLSKVIFPANLTTIEDYAFCGETFPAAVFSSDNYKPMQESILKEFVGLENTKIETIGRGAFACLTRLNTLLLPKTLKTMGASGDAALSPIAKAGLSVIVLNSSISNAVTLQYNIENEEDSWTYNLSATVGEMQPKGVYSKGQFELSWKVEKIDEKWWIVGYLGTSSNLIVPNTVVNDDGEIVQVHGIKSLNYQDATQITVSNGIKEIGHPTDSNNILGSTSNSKLNAIVLMGDVQNMTENSLLGMKELSYITLSNDLPTANSFAPTGKTTWYHYSNGTSEIVSAYQKAGIYTAGELQKENQEWVVDSDGYIIAYKGSKTELVVPSHLLRQDSDNVIIVKGIKSFKNNTYGSATTLAAVTSVTISNGIKTIEDSTDGAFRYLSNVVEINIPSTMTYIGHNAFLPCTALETLTIPNGVETIQVSALPMDKSLSTIILEGNLKNNFVIPSSYGTWFYNSEQTPIDELSIAGTYKKATYSIKYDGKGATLSSGETSYIKSNFLQGKSITLDENQFTNQSNANFLGWTTKPRSVHVEYPAGGQFKLDNTTHVPTSDYTITLYAVWEQNIKILTLDPKWNNSADAERGYTATKFGQSTNISQQIDLDFTTEIVMSGSFATTANTNSSVLTHLQSDSSNIKLAIIQNKLEVQVNNAKVLSTNTLAIKSGYSYFIHKTGSTIRLKVLSADGTTFFDNSQSISQLSGTTLTFGIGYANNDNGIIYGSTMLFESAMLKLAYLPDATNVKHMLKINEDGSKISSALNEATSVTTTTLAVYKMIPTSLRSTLPPEVLPSRFGYQIDGYYYNQAGSSASIYYTIGNSSILEGIDAYPYDADVVAEAYWIAKSITIKWNANGGTGSATNMKVYFDQVFKTRGVNDGISRVGYTLTGWHAEGWRDFDAQITPYQFNYIKSDWSRSATSYEITFYAIWTPNQYTVTFNPNGGSVSPTTKTVTYDSAYGDLPTPTRTGYTFVGWKLNGTVITSSTKVQTASNHTLHAEWTANKYNIKFQANDATLVEKLWNYAGSTGYTSSNKGSYDKYSHNGSRTAELNEANYITFDGPLSFYTPIPIRIGHKFVGWYSAQTGGVKVADANGSLVANANGYTGANKEWKHADVATLYARWEAETYSITYSLDGGTNGSNAPTTYQFGNTKQISDPTKTGYTFAGWEVVATLDGKRYGTIDYDTGVLKYESGYSKAVYFPLFYQTANVAYTGKGSDQNGEIRWRQFNTSGTYRGNNGNTSSTNCYVSLWYYGGMNAANTTIKWSQSAGYTIPTTQVGALSLTAKWTPNTYHVTYHPNGGTGTMESQSVTFDRTMAIKDCTFTKTGYQFVGWLTKYPDGSFENDGWTNWSGKWTYDDGQYGISNKTLNLYAKWSANTYSVTFNPGSGKFLTTTSVTIEANTDNYNYRELSSLDVKITKNTTYTLKFATATHTAGSATQFAVLVYDFTDGVTKAKTLVSFGNNVTATLTTDSSVVQSNKNKLLIYSANNGETAGNGATFTGITLTVTKSVTYDSTYGDLPTPTRAGYTFKGWYTSASDGTKVTSTTKVTTASNHTIHAQWTANTYTVVYNGNGNTGGSTASSTHTYDVAKNLTANGFTKRGYTFAGWATSQSGNVVHADKASVKNLSATQGATVQLYAKWTPNKITITLNKNGGSGGTEKFYYTYGIKKFYSDANLTQELTSITFPTRTGYTFSHYYGDGTSGGNENEQYSMTTSGVTSTDLHTDIYKDATLYAKWNINSYTLSIDPNGGYRVSDNSTAVITVTKNYQASENISERRKTGYTLTGYTLKNTASGSTTDIGGATFTFNNSTKTGMFTQGAVACTLVAQWTANTYAATFENMYWSLSKAQYNNGGTWSSDSSTGEDIYQSVSSTNNGGPYISNIATYMENNLRYRITFTAKVSANPLTLNASFEAGSSISISLTTSYQTFNLDTSYNAAATYKALTFYTTGWTGQKLYIKDVKLSKLVTYDSTYGTLPTPTRTGYTFAGWSKNMFNPIFANNYSPTCTRDGGTFTYNTGSKNTSNSFQIQTWNNTTYLNAGLLTTSSTGISSVQFTKDSTITRLRLKLNGSHEDSVFFYNISSLPDGIYVIQVNVVSIAVNKIVIKDVMIEQNANNTRTSYVSSSTHVSSDTTVKDPFNRTLFAEWTPNKYTVTFDPNNKGGLISTQTSDGTYSGNNMTLYYTAYNHEYKLVNATSNDPFAQIGQTVYLTANTTYLMHAEVYNSSGSVIPSSSGSIQIFYAIGGAYSEGNSRRFYANTTYQTFTVPTTGTYNIRIDNDCGQTVRVRKFWIYRNFTYQKTVTYDATYGTLPTPTRIGYTFVGWYTASSGGTQVTDSTKVTNSSNHTLYAQWTKVSDVTGSATIDEDHYTGYYYGYSGIVTCGGFDVNFIYQNARGKGTYCAVYCTALGDTYNIEIPGKNDYDTSFSNATVSGSQCTYTVSWNASTRVATITISF